MNDNKELRKRKAVSNKKANVKDMKIECENPKKQKHVQLIDKIETVDVGLSDSIEPQRVKAIRNKNAVSLSSEEGCESEDEVQISIEERVGISGGGKVHYIESAHVPFDEVALKQSGFLDCHCHHLTIGCEMHKDDKKLSDDNQQVNVVSIANVNVGSPESNETTMASLHDLLTKAENMLNELRFKHEYIECLNGVKGQGLAIWNDGTEDNYLFTNGSIYQIVKQPH